MLVAKLMVKLERLNLNLSEEEVLNEARSIGIEPFLNNASQKQEIPNSECGKLIDHLQSEFGRAVSDAPVESDEPATSVLSERLAASSEASSITEAAEDDGSFTKGDLGSRPRYVSVAAGDQDDKTNYDLKSWEECKKSASESPMRGGVGVVGKTGAGKTCFLYMVGRENRSREYGDWTMQDLSPDFNNFVDDLNNKLRGRNPYEYKKIMKTQGGHAPSLLDLFSVTASGRETISVKSYDAAGEDWFTALSDRKVTQGRQSMEAINKLREMFSLCEGFVFLLDASELLDRNNIDVIEDTRNFWRHFSGRLKMSRRNNKNQVVVPVALVLNKIDCLVAEPDLWTDPDADNLTSKTSGSDSSLLAHKIEWLLQTMKELVDLALSPKLYRTKLKESSDERQECSRRILEFGFPSIADAVDVDGLNILNCVEVFSISCFGHKPEEEELTLPRPIAIEEPLGWIFETISRQRFEKKVADAVDAARATTEKGLGLFNQGRKNDALLAYKAAIELWRNTVFPLFEASDVFQQRYASSYQEYKNEVIQYEEDISRIETSVFQEKLQKLVSLAEQKERDADVTEDVTKKLDQYAKALDSWRDAINFSGDSAGTGALRKKIESLAEKIESLQSAVKQDQRRRMWLKIRRRIQSAALLIFLLMVMSGCTCHVLYDVGIKQALAALNVNNYEQAELWQKRCYVNPLSRLDRYRIKSLEVARAMRSHCEQRFNQRLLDAEWKEAESDLQYIRALGRVIGLTDAEDYALVEKFHVRHVQAMLVNNSVEDACRAFKMVMAARIDQQDALLEKVASVWEQAVNSQVETDFKKAEVLLDAMPQAIRSLLNDGVDKLSRLIRQQELAHIEKTIRQCIQTRQLEEAQKQLELLARKGKNQLGDAFIAELSGQITRQEVEQAKEKFKAFVNSGNLPEAKDQLDIIALRSGQIGDKSQTAVFAFEYYLSAVQQGFEDGVASGFKTMKAVLDEIDDNKAGFFAEGEEQWNTLLRRVAAIYIDTIHQAEPAEESAVLNALRFPPKSLAECLAHEQARINAVWRSIHGRKLMRFAAEGDRLGLREVVGEMREESKNYPPNDAIWHDLHVALAGKVKDLRDRAGVSQATDFLTFSRELLVFASVDSSLWRELGYELELENCKQAFRKGDLETASKLLDLLDVNDGDKLSTRRLKEHLNRVRSMCFVPIGDSGIYMDRFEVSIGCYVESLSAEKMRVFVARFETQHKDGKNYSSDDFFKEHSRDEPVRFVSLKEAAEYARSLNKRLPSVSEWMAAYGDRTYPWGDQWEAGRAITRDLPGRGPRKHTEKSMDVSGYGVVNLAGNVSEWTLSNDGNASLVKGGNWYMSNTYSAKNAEFEGLDNRPQKFIGFRCVCDALPEL
jgi:hypothetical protein